MAYEQKPNSGSLFANNRKTEESHPTHTGTALIDGKEYYINAWVKEGKEKRFFSMSFRPKQPKQAAPEPEREPYDRPAPIRPVPPDLNDEIPF